MPSDTRYVRAATARRSPNARLYSAVPRSSQWPSMVTVQLGYRFRTVAFSVNAVCAGVSSSALSRAKNAGLSGELRLRSSSEADEMESLGTGSGGTTVGSATGSGGAGGRVAAADAVVTGGGAGRATGGVFLPQPTAVSPTTRRIGAADRIVIVKTPSSYFDQSGW